ncbi:hypothetical protein CASFOL_004827 [Castilleja foliolosa]|uniref:CCHC-type domain-containing protein n=1 Tax=Castilleja foliolosa TaxID=1961234 RepID=A0ABD3EBK3_9LAMI
MVFSPFTFSIPPSTPSSAMNPDTNIPALSSMSIKPPLECSVPNLTNIEKETTLVVKFLSPKPVNMNAFKSTITKAWNQSDKISTNLLADNTMAFIFESEQDIEKVCKSSWTFRDHQLVIARWPPDKALSEIDLTKTNLWIHAFGIPPKMEKSLRMQVEIDTSKPFSDSMIFAIQGTKKLMLELRYECTSDICFKCGRLGHRAVTCNFPIDDGNGNLEPEIFGPWLKFENQHIPNPKFNPLSTPEKFPSRFINTPSQTSPPPPPPSEENPNSPPTKNPDPNSKNSLSYPVKIPDTTSGQNQLTVDKPQNIPNTETHQPLHIILSADYATQSAYLDRIDKDEAIFSLPDCNLINSELSFVSQGLYGKFTPENSPHPSHGDKYVEELRQRDSPDTSLKTTIENRFSSDNPA